MRWLLLLTMAGAGCSVISTEVRAVAEPEAPYRDLVKRADELMGKTVVLGGYVLETDAGADESVVVVLQAPLDSFDLPGDSDDSQGRFLLVHLGYLDPAIYTAGRAVTVAGEVAGVIADTDECPARCLQLETRDLYLWDERVHAPVWVTTGQNPYLGWSWWGPPAPHYFQFVRYPHVIKMRPRPPRRQK